MPTYYAVVVKDPVVARTQEIARNVAANRAAHVSALISDAERARRERFITQQVERMVGRMQPMGSLHDVASVECPEGMANCRNCGDPKHAAACRAAGHCPACGTRHGIAPDRLVAEHGYELIPLAAPPQAGQAWDPARRAFV
jgi:rubrerythrin